MPDLKSLDNIYLVLGFLVPGLIIVFVRSRFLTGRITPHNEAILSYLVLSIIYYALALPCVEWTLSIDEAGYKKALAWVSLVFIGPAILGVGLGCAAQLGWARKLIHCCGFTSVHVIPTAWDWKFSSPEEQWVLVTLKDGRQIAGFFGQNSFSSSDPKERDVYIERIYDLSDDGKWSQRGDTGILIASDEVQTVEFWSPNIHQENVHEKR